MLDGASLLREPLATAVLKGSGWTARNQGFDQVVVLTGDWIARRTGTEISAAERLPTCRSLRAISFDATQLGRWDSALIVFLSVLWTQALKLGVAFDRFGLPQPARRLLALAAFEIMPEAKPTGRDGLTDRVGRRVIAGWSEIVEILALVGDTILRPAPVAIIQSGRPVLPHRRLAPSLSPTSLSCRRRSRS
jgi:phospholipid/cholesterol/gamma-HCH transport system permease protein